MAMTRKNFLQTAVAGSLAAAGASSQSGDTEAERLESDRLVLRVFRGGTFAVTMRGSGDPEWSPDPWQGVACRVSFLPNGSGAPQTIELGKTGSVEIRKTGSGVRCEFSAQGVAVVTRLQLQGSVLRAAVEEVRLPDNAWLVSVEYPFRSFFLRTGKDDGYLVLPSGEGCLIPSGTVKLGALRFWSWLDESRSEASDVTDPAPILPFYGAQKNGAGFTAVLETSDDFHLRYLLNSDGEHLLIASGRQSPYPQIACAWPLWLGQKGRLGYQRGVRFEFASGLDYNQMAKVYRKEAIARGCLVTLREKARQRPQISRLAGAPYLIYYAGYPHQPPDQPNFHYTYGDLKEVIADLSGSLGLRRAFIHFWGAYTVQPPGSMPFDTRPGPIADLKAAVDMSKAAGFLFTLYNDISAQLEETSLWMPELMWKDRGGRVAGGRWMRTCSSQFVKLLARGFPEAVRTLGLEAAYIDCINHAPTRECYDPKHPLTRGEERAARTALYQYVHSLGLVFGGEQVSWWNVPDIEYGNGAAVRLPRGLLTLFPVPLYHLVFHDALVPFGGEDYTLSHASSFQDKVLRDLLRGVPPLFILNLRDHHRWRTKIHDSYAMTSDTVAAVMYEELLSHRWITDDQLVQRTQFASGVEVTANFDEEQREGLPPKSFRVSGLGSVRTG